MSTIAFIGDVGGHARLYADALRSLGANPTTGVIPHGLIIIQVGDLVRLAIRRGAFSDECVAISDRFLSHSPDQFVQLWGNHEIAALGGPTRPAWIGEIPQETCRTMWRWWTNRQAHSACVVHTKNGNPLLVTHAGLTYDVWQHTGGGNATATAQALNTTMRQPQDSHAGILVHNQVDFSADVLWADAAQELHPSWVGREAAPFDQIHGHSSIWDWYDKKFVPHIPKTLQDNCAIDIERMITYAELTPGNVAIGIDWVLNDRATIGPWPLFVLNNVTLDTSTALSTKAA